MALRPSRVARFWCTSISRTRVWWWCSVRPFCPRRRLSRRIRAVSAIPIEGLIRSLSFGAHAGSIPNTVQNRFHSTSRGPPGCGTVTRWTWSGSRPAPHRLSTLGSDCERQNHMLSLRCAVSRNFWKVQRRPCLMLSCQNAGSWRAMSRAEKTTCTSLPSRSAIALAIFSAGAAARISWLRITVPRLRRTLRISASQ